MTPIDFATRLAASDSPADRTLGVAMIARALTDDDPADPFREPWPLTDDVIRTAARHIGAPTLTDDDVRDVRAIMPTISDAMLNRAPR